MANAYKLSQCFDTDAGNAVADAKSSSSGSSNWNIPRLVANRAASGDPSRM